MQWAANIPAWMSGYIELAFERFVERKWKDALNVGSCRASVIMSSLCRDWEDRSILDEGERGQNICGGSVIKRDEAREVPIAGTLVCTRGPPTSPMHRLQESFC